MKTLWRCDGTLPLLQNYFSKPGSLIIFVQTRFSKISVSPESLVKINAFSKRHFSKNSFPNRHFSNYCFSNAHNSKMMANPYLHSSDFKSSHIKRLFLQYTNRTWKPKTKKVTGLQSLAALIDICIIKLLWPYALHRRWFSVSKLFRMQSLRYEMFSDVFRQDSNFFTMHRMISLTDSNPKH